MSSNGRCCPGAGCAVLAVLLLGWTSTGEAADPPRIDVTQPAQLDRAARDVERWAASQAWARDARTPDEWLAAIQQLLDARGDVDRQLDGLLNRRTEFAAQEEGEQRRARVRAYLATTARVIALSGRLRYLLRDAIDNATTELSSAPDHLDRLVELLIERPSQIGATRMAYALFDPPADEDLQPFPDAMKRRVLELMEVTRPTEVLEELAEYVANPRTPPELVLAAASAMRAIGLPQDVPPDQDPKLPRPPLTATSLRAVLQRLDPSSLSDETRAKRAELLTWLTTRAERGVDEASYRVGTCDVRPGDWLLMRNPSPYNRFTDHSPGLFTHVGVVAEMRDERGVRRMVVVDLPERGERIPATNVELFLRRTLHYVFLRHRDAEVARQLGEVAARLIGHSSQFDLQFRTDRVLALEGKPLDAIVAQPVHTYCAGFLLLCAQQTSAPWREFFPIVEQPASQRCLDNLGILGLSIGKDFLSPTGALFSQHLEVVGRCEPMYEPTREIQDAVFDAFAQGMIEKRLTPSPDAYQALREQLGSLSRRNRTLARALARVNNVSENLDLESAAKAAAVIETLDEIAQRASDEFVAAREALTASPEAPPPTAGRRAKRDENAELRRYRRQHAALYASWTAGRLTPTQLREALVDYYRQQGVRQLEDRFFR